MNISVYNKNGINPKVLDKILDNLDRFGTAKPLIPNYQINKPKYKTKIKNYTLSNQIWGEKIKNIFFYK